MAEPLPLAGLLGKAESSYGTDPTPTVGDNGIRLADAPGFWNSIRVLDQFPNSREDVASGSLIPVAGGLPTGKYAEIQATVEIKGLGSAYADSEAGRPEADPLIWCCGVSRATVTTGGSESVTYALADTSHGSSTFWCYAGGHLIKVSGCRGNVVYNFQAGELTTATFTVMGLVTAISDTALPAITYDSVQSPAAVGVGLDINDGSTWNPVWSQAALDYGNDVRVMPDGNAADGIQSFEIVRRAPRFTITTQVAALATYNPYTLRDDQTAQTIDGTFGSTQYERFDLDIGGARLPEPPTHEDFDGVAGWGLTYALQSADVVFD